MFDGIATVLGMAPVANVYTLTKEIMVRNMTVNAGVRVFAANFAIFVSGTLTGAGSVDNDGADAITFNGGLSTPTTPRFFRTAAGGGSGNPGESPGASPYPWFSNAAGGAGGIAPNGNGQPGTAPGGGGGGGAAGGNGAAGGSVTATGSTEAADYVQLIIGRYIATGSTFTQGAGGGSGNTSVGQEGGGGASGGFLLLAANQITGTLAIHARGGRGANGGVAGAPGGGGGGGGMTIVFSESIGVGVTIDANGGAGGNGNAGGGNGGVGAAGVVATFLL